MILQFSPLFIFNSSSIRHYKFDFFFSSFQFFFLSILFFTQNLFFSCPCSIWAIICEQFYHHKYYLTLMTLMWLYHKWNVLTCACITYFCSNLESQTGHWHDLSECDIVLHWAGTSATDYEYIISKELVWQQLHLFLTLNNFSIF